MFLRRSNEHELIHDKEFATLSVLNETSVHGNVAFIKFDHRAGADLTKEFGGSWQNTWVLR